MANPKRKQGDAAGTTPNVKAKRGPPFIIRIYLILYNVISCLGWGYVLVHTVTHLTGYDFKHFKLPVSETPSPVEVKLHEAQDIAHRLLALLVKYIPFLSPFVSTETKIRAQVPNDFQALWGRAASTFVEVYPQTKIVQTAAALEIVHSLFGFVRSPLLTTIMQVASRLQLVWGIAERFPSIQTNPLFASMVFAWSLTEVIRYSFYAFSLIGLEPYPLLWLRYTTFFLLYPIGAGSEAFLMYSTLPKTSPLDGNWTPDEYFRGALFLTWWPALLFLYTHMIKQRRKIIGGGRISKIKTQ